MYATKYDLVTLTCQQYNTVSGVIRLLKPFDELTVLCSSDTETASSIIPNVKTTMKYLAQLSESDKDIGVRTMKNALLDSVKKRFPDTESSAGNINLADNNLVYATFLDPRYKCLFTEENKVSDLINALVIKITELNESNKESDEAAETSIGKNRPGEHQNLEVVIHEDFWSCFETLKDEKEIDDTEAR